MPKVFRPSVSQQMATLIKRDMGSDLEKPNIHYLTLSNMTEGESAIVDRLKGHARHLCNHKALSKQDLPPEEQLQAIQKSVNRFILQQPVNCGPALMQGCLEYSREVFNGLQRTDRSLASGLVNTFQPPALPNNVLVTHESIATVAPMASSSEDVPMVPVERPSVVGVATQGA